MLTLYFSPGSSSMATHIALYEVGVPFAAKLNLRPARGRLCFIQSLRCCFEAQ